MYALATDDDYNGGSLVPIIEFNANIVLLRRAVNYSPQDMAGSYSADRMHKVEPQNEVKAAGIPKPAAIYFLI